MHKDVKPVHNNFFEGILSKTPIMVDFLKSHVPERICSALDFSTLRFEKDNYVGQAMTKLRSDMLVSVQLKDAEGFIQFLIEHQSNSERWMVLRIQEYIDAILRQYSQSSMGHWLPFIYPMVLFTNKRQWLYPKQFKEYLPPKVLELFSEQVNNTIHFIDIHRIDDNILNSHGLATVVEQMLKYGPQYDIIKVLECSKTGLKRYAEHPNEVDMVLTYLLNVCTDAREQMDQAVKWCYKNLWETAGETMATIAEQLRAEGMQLGEQRGIRLGEQRGMRLGEERGIRLGEERGEQRGEQRIIKSMLSRGHDAETIQALTGISVEKIEALAEDNTLAS